MINHVINVNLPTSNLYHFMSDYIKFQTVLYHTAYQSTQTAISITDSLRHPLSSDVVHRNFSVNAGI